MHFAMICADRYKSVFQSFVTAGWQPIKFFTQLVDNQLSFNHEAVAYAQLLGIEIQLSPITQKDLEALGKAGCEALVVAEYGSRIPDWRPFMGHAVNFHPSPLPEARGRFPQVRAILEELREWAMTCHKISDRFDRGDILDSEAFPLGADETLERLDIKLQMAAQTLAGRVAANFAELWDNAQPQGKGSYWPMLTEEDRKLDFGLPVESILRRIRAFGKLETIARPEAMTIYVSRASGWTETHSHEPGKIVHLKLPAIVVAASDGYICVHGWRAFPKETLPMVESGSYL